MWPFYAGAVEIAPPAFVCAAWNDNSRLVGAD
jgi:hypothetical protein